MPAPKVHRASKGKFFFCATRPVPAPRVHSESIFFFCAARPVPALKVHKGKQGHKIFRVTRAFFFSLLGPVPTPKVHKESKEKFSCRYALESRKLCVSLGVNKVKNVPSLCATECNN